MMREILFRGKRIDTGEWVYGDLVHSVDFGEDGLFDIVQIWAKGVHFPVVYPETVGQYTGLDDKNGVKIFEGDIVSYLHDDWIEPDIGVVKYMVADGYPAFDMESDLILEYNLLSLITQSGDYSYFVAGNIYDNPELMEGTK